MVVVLEHGIRDADKDRIRSFLESRGMNVREIVGQDETIFGAVGRLSIDPREVEVLPGVLRVIPITKPYKLASRELKSHDTVIDVKGVKIGGKRIVVMAGPCSVESEEQIMESARLAHKSGAVVLRGGAFKPRTSPYSFQGMGEEGLRLLKAAGDAYGMPVISEIVSPTHIDVMSRYVDILQIGTRNMQNFELLKAAGESGMPVMLKRGLAATIEEWLMAAEYLLHHGTDDVILCERGIRTFETYTRNSLDISSIPVAKKLSHLPVFVDPSHATGIRAKVHPVGLAAIAAGADGLIVEMHPNPEQALSDGPQSLYPDQLERLLRDVQAMAPVLGKELARPDSAHSLRKRARHDARDSNASEVLRIAFQGERGAYSEAAAELFFGQAEMQTVPEAGFGDVFEAVLEGRADYGIVPLENSLAGSVHENFDLMLQYPDISIVGEIKIRIVHSLIALPGTGIDDIDAVYSHPQGLAQCTGFLDEHPGWDRIPTYDTAGSVARIAAEGQRSHAAIASSQAAKVYGMEVLKESIETNPRNYTRFAVLALGEEPGEGRADKASLVFATPDRPGALLECMKVLSDQGLNLKKLESRPILGKPWEYMFYVDVEVPEDRSRLDEGIAELDAIAQELRLLGVYRSA